MGNSFQELLNETRQVKLSELTTAGDIAFIPGGFKSVSSILKGMAKKKKDWQIQVIETEDGSTFNFEGALRISVDKKDIPAFYTQVLEVDTLPDTRNPFMFSLPMSLYESVQEVEAAYDLLEDALLGYLIKDNGKVLDDHVEQWERYFGVKNYLPTKAFVSVSGVDAMEEALTNQLSNIRKIYGDDLKQITAITKALTVGRGLDGIRPFSAFNYMVGAKIVSRYGGIDLTYEVLLGMDGQLSESIYVGDAEVLDTVDGNPKVKVVKNTIFPQGKVFPSSIFKELRDDIKNNGGAE